MKVNKNWYNYSMDSTKKPLSDEPVAYDVNGQPLYSHPHPPSEPVKVDTPTPVVHIARPAEPDKPIINATTKLKHDRSSQMYPNLNLSEGEFVITAVRRHPIGLLAPFAIALLLIAVSFLILFNYESVAVSLQIYGDLVTFAIILPIILFVTLVVLVTYVAFFVYTNNKFYLTNESVIQEIQTGLFSKNEQTVSLMDIEDASFTQNGIIQQFFDYGSIRLSTEGDETTYRFSYVAGPKNHIATLTNAIEAFKNGRPVEDADY